MPTMLWFPEVFDLPENSAKWLNNPNNNVKNIFNNLHNNLLNLILYKFNN